MGEGGEEEGVTAKEVAHCWGSLTMFNRIAAAGQVVIGVAMLTAGCAQNATTVGHSVSYRDLGHRVKVIGSLGAPLGTELVIEGQYVDGDTLNSKGTEGITLIRVERVNGKPLADTSLLKFGFCPGLREPVSTKHGQSFRFRGYEDGGFRGVPPVQLEHPFASHGWCFVTFFHVAQVQQPGVETPITNPTE